MPVHSAWPGLVVRESTGRPSPSSARANQPRGSQNASLNRSRQARGGGTEVGGGVAERHGAREVGGAEQRGVGVALHLDERDGTLGQRAVGERHAVPGVLPALVGQPERRAPLVVDEAVAVAVPGPSIQSSAASTAGAEAGEIARVRGRPSATPRRRA